MNSLTSSLLNHKKEEGAARSYFQFCTHTLTIFIETASQTPDQSVEKSCRAGVIFTSSVK